MSSIAKEESIYNKYDFLKKEINTLITDRNIDKNILDSLKQILKIIEEHKKINITNIGLLKAGKSSLFNALYGEEIFKSDVVRATVENSMVELHNYNLVDTPGLNANDKDDETAFKAYEHTDIFLFVHNIQEGELIKSQINEIEKVLNRFSWNKNNFFDNTVLVLTHKDQLANDEFNDIKSVIEEQINNVFSMKFKHIIEVNSIGYLKGKKENKEKLIQSSNIENLKDILQDISRNSVTFFDSIIEKKVTDILLNIEDSLKKLEMNLDIKKKELQNMQYDNLLSKDKLLKEIDYIANNTLNKYKSLNLDFTIRKPNLEPRVSYSSYKSKSQAESAAKKACSTAIRNAASYARTEGMHIIDSISNPDLKFIDIKKNLKDSFNKIKELYYNNVNVDKNIKDLDLNFSSSTNIKEDIEKIRTSIENIGSSKFKSSNYYLTAYSANMYIETDYEEQYVTGLFGGGRYKEVKVYNWEIDGAVDDIEEDTVEILKEILEPLKNIYQDIVKNYNDEILSKYKLSIDDVKRCINNSSLKLDELRDGKDIINNIENRIHTYKNLKQRISYILENRGTV